MLIKNFLQFVLEKIDSVKVPFQMSHRFQDILGEIDSPIGRAMIEILMEPNDISLIDIGDDKNMVSFTQGSKLSELFKETDFNILSTYIRPLYRDSGEIYHRSRTNIRIGRLIKKIFIDKFTDSQIEKFVNQYSALCDGGLKFETYNGRGIKVGYESRRYTNDGQTANPLLNSCMNDHLDVIDFYSGCPVSLLVLVDDENIIYGRALVWEFDGGVFMDRVYVANDSDYYKFIGHASKNGWFYKDQNKSGARIEYAKNGKNVGWFKIEIKLKFNVNDYKQWGFPYLDSLIYAYGNIISNSKPKQGTYYVLVSTDGGYETGSNLCDVHGDAIFQQDLDNGDYIFSVYQGGYIHVNNAINVKYSSIYPGYSFNDWIEENELEKDMDFTYSDLDGKWYLKKHCVWSNFDNNFIYRGNAIYIQGDPVHNNNMYDYYDAHPEIKHPLKK